MKSYLKKISKVVLFSTVLLLGTVMLNTRTTKLYKAEENTISQLINSVDQTVSGGKRTGYIYEEDLDQTAYLYCRQNGIHLTSKDLTKYGPYDKNHPERLDLQEPDSPQDTAVVSSEDFYRRTGIDKILKGPDVSAGEELYPTIVETNLYYSNGSRIQANNRNPYYDYSDPNVVYQGVENTKTAGYYTASGAVNLTPAEAYIFSHVKTLSTGIYDSNNPSKTQWAFWEYLSHNGIPKSAYWFGTRRNQYYNDGIALCKEAEAFEAHVKKGRSQLVDNTKYPSNKEYPAQNEVSVSYSKDTRTYLVGPFRVNYTRDFVTTTATSEMSIKQGNPGKVNFSGISAATLYGLTSGGQRQINNWSFVYPNARPLQAGDEDYIYPYPNEEFYLSIPYSGNEDLTGIASLSFEYFDLFYYEGNKYNLDGTYKDVRWKAITKWEWCTENYATYCTEHPGQPYHHQISIPDYWDPRCLAMGAPSTGVHYENCNCQLGRTKTCEAEGMCSHHRTAAMDAADPDIDSATGRKGHASVKYYECHAEIAGVKPSQKLTSLGYARVWSEKSTTVLNINAEFIMHMAGTVWEDQIYTKESDSDGEYKNNAGDIPLAGVDVQLIRVDNGAVVKTTETDKNGNWRFDNIPIVFTYNVKFIYNGMVYTPTDPLRIDTEANKFNTFKQECMRGLNISEEVFNTMYQNNREELELWHYKSNPNSSIHFNNSKAIENAQARVDFNNRYARITNTNINNENTGIAYGKNGGTTNLQYAMSEVNGQKVASLITTDSNGKPLEQYKMEATTQQLGVTYTIENNFNVSNIWKTVNGVTYSRVYPYLEHINLGLIKRTKVDFSLREDVSNVKMTVNKNEINYRYNKREDMDFELEKKLQEITNGNALQYTADIYPSDFNYRYEDYKQNELNTNQNIINAILGSKTPEDELRVFTTYKIVIKNRSSENYGTINELVNYFDTTYTLITGDVTQTLYKLGDNGKTTQETETRVVATKSNYVTTAEDGTTKTGTVDWTISPNEVNGYKQMTSRSLQNERLAPGQSITVYITFEVQKATDSEYQLSNAIIRGEKEQFAEIKEYATYLNATETNYIGKIDYNSNPYNYIPGNDKYEDDTSNAPIINIRLKTDGTTTVDRLMDGLVWEDNRTNTLVTQQIVGDGVRKDGNNGETLINGVTVQLIELIKKDGNQYEYVWREMSTSDTDYKFVDNGGVVKNTKDSPNQLKHLVPVEAQNGRYVFNAFVSGNYIVRFKYGDTNDTVLKVADGGKNDKSYNGHDFKSTAYQKDFNTLKSEWYDLSNQNLNNAKVSDAKDNEQRRLEGIKYTSTISNYVANVLSAPENNPTNVELIEALKENTQMYADTAKLAIRIEYDTNEIDSNADKSYVVKSVDLGIEERPKASIELNKEVSRIRVILANGKTQVDTNTNFNQDVLWAKGAKTREDASIISVYLDEELMQGATVIIDYKFTIKNNSEIETVGDKEFLDQIKDKEIPTISATDSIGTYLGETYYTGKFENTAENARYTSIRIDKILDYVDNNIIYRKEDSREWDEVPLSNLQKLKEEFSKENYISGKLEINNNHLIVTEQLKDKEIYPYEQKEIGLTLSKVLSPENEADDLFYGNIAEIIELTSTTGRRDYEAIPGNQDPENPPSELDSDWSENVGITKPTGENRIYYILGATIGIILIAGIILIKKKVLDNKSK